MVMKPLRDIEQVHPHWRHSHHQWSPAPWHRHIPLHVTQGRRHIRYLWFHSTLVRFSSRIYPHQDSRTYYTKDSVPQFQLESHRPFIYHGLTLERHTQPSHLVQFSNSRHVRVWRYEPLSERRHVCAVGEAKFDQQGSGTPMPVPTPAHRRKMREK